MLPATSLTVGCHWFVVLFLLLCVVASSVEAAKSDTPLQCYVCFSPDDCGDRSTLTTCTSAVVRNTAIHFSPIVRHPYTYETNEFSCITYSARLTNGSLMQVSGCLSASDNACEKVDPLPLAHTWTCKFCDTSNGCNVSPADRSRVSGGLIVLAVLTIAVGAM